MPCAVEMIDLLLRTPGNGEAREQAIEDRAVQAVDVLPAYLAAHDAVHGRPVAGAPGIGESRAVDAQALGGSEQLGLADDGGAPVDHRAENVEGERSYLHHDD